MTIRPIRPEDEPLMIRFHQTLTEESVYQRYFSSLKLTDRIAHERLTRICFNDYDREIALVVERKGPKADDREILGVGRLSKLHGRNEAEFALLISDHWQRQGLGKELMRRLVEIGRAEKLSRLSAIILPWNLAMQHVAESAGLKINRDLGAREYSAEIKFMNKGDDARSTPPPLPRAHRYRFVLLGAPGVGKSTQAQFLSKHFGACHLSTGEMFRYAKDHLAEGEPGPAMKAALEYMNRGELVPDDTVLALVAEHLQCVRGRGFLLDGFPRTVGQAQGLKKLLAEQGVHLRAVLNYELPLQKIIARLSGRRTCLKCKASFHIESLPPKIDGVCDHCGGALVQRDDDRPEAIRTRLAAYNKNAGPLKRFYQRRKLLVSVDADGPPEEIFNRTLEALKKMNEEKFDVHHSPS